MIPFRRITTNPEICDGKPCIRGLRFPVSRLLGLLAAGETSETILKSYPYCRRVIVYNIGEASPVNEFTD